jgi:hypothetical protein
MLIFEAIYFSGYDVRLHLFNVYICREVVVFL